MKSHVFVVLIASFCPLFYACKKDKLEGDKSILIGEWEWVYTEKIVDYCDPDYMYTAVLTPLTENITYQIKFFEKGRVAFYQNNKLIEDHRIVFNAFGAPACSTYFEIYLDNVDSSFFRGCVDEDSLTVLEDFPYPDKDVFESGVDCYLTTSYFVSK